MNEKIPLADYFSASHSQARFTQFLFSIKKIFQTVKCAGQKQPFASIMVTDPSFALINSVHDVFNNCSLINYLDWTYEIFVENINLGISMPVKTILCSVHFLKLMAKKAKKMIKPKEADQFSLGEAFTLAFTILQHSFKFEEFVAS
jgi:hypothetical protein